MITIERPDGWRRKYRNVVEALPHTDEITYSFDVDRRGHWVLRSKGEVIYEVKRISKALQHAIDTEFLWVYSPGIERYERKPA